VFVAVKLCEGKTSSRPNRVSVDKSFVRIINDDSIKLFLRLLKSINWITVYSLNSKDDKYKKFMELFLWAVNGAFQLKTSKKSDPKVDNKWYTYELGRLKEHCVNLHSLLKIFKTNELSLEYKSYRRLYMSGTKRARVQYYNRIIEQSQNKSNLNLFGIL